MKHDSQEALKCVFLEKERLQNLADNVPIPDTPAQVVPTTAEEQIFPVLMDYDDEYTSPPYSSFELLLTEHGAPSNIDYFMSMYASRAGYCDVLGDDVEKMDEILVARDPILAAIKAYRSPEGDGCDGMD